MRPITAFLLAPLILALGCATGGGEAVQDDLPIIVSGQIIGYDALIVVTPEAEEDLPLSSGNLEAFRDDILNQLNGLSISNRIPPVFPEGIEFVGRAARVETRVNSVERTTRRKFRWFGPEVREFEIGISIHFADAQTGDSLGDWVDLTEYIDPAVGRSVQMALRVAAGQVSNHVLRDYRGQ